MDVGGLEHRVLQMRGNDLHVVTIERDEPETLHDPAFVVGTEQKVGKPLAAFKSPPTAPSK